MAAIFEKVDLGDGIITFKEKFRDAAVATSTKSSPSIDEVSLEREKRRQAQEYARQMAEYYESRVAELTAHARKLGEAAMLLQRQVEEREREQAKEVDAELEQTFRALADKWRLETRMLSSDSDIAANFSYHQIIGMGEKALPLIFREMRERGGRWFWALRAITRQNPIRPEDRGNVRRMTEAWLEWGRRHKYV